MAEPSLCCVHRFLTSLYTVIFSLQFQLRVRVCCVRDRAKDKKRKVVGSWKERSSLSCYTYVMSIYACSYLYRFHNLVLMYFAFIQRTVIDNQWFKWLWIGIQMYRFSSIFWINDYYSSRSQNNSYNIISTKNVKRINVYTRHKLTLQQPLAYNLN